MNVFLRLTSPKFMKKVTIETRTWLGYNIRVVPTLNELSNKITYPHFIHHYSCYIKMWHQG